MSVSSALGGYGAPVSIDLGDRVVTVRPMEWGEVVSAMIEWMRQAEIKRRMRPFEILVERGHLTKDELTEKTIALAIEVEENGECDFDGPKMRELLDATTFVVQSGTSDDEQARAKAKSLALKHHEGMEKLISLITGLSVQELSSLRDHPKADELMSKVATVIVRSLPKELRRNMVPAA